MVRASRSRLAGLKQLLRRLLPEGFSPEEVRAGAPLPSTAQQRLLGPHGLLKCLMLGARCYS